MNVIELRSGEWTPNLSAAERLTVFSIARDSLDWCVKHSDRAFDFGGYALTDALRVERATFVTLHKRGMLRGCIGSLRPEVPLFSSVHENAVSAATRDPRFPAVLEKELPLLRVDVSILSPIVPIDGPDAFRVGEHGIILEKGWRRAVYLPEVATEQGWTVEETLCSLSEKAGMAPDAWRDGTSFKIFSSVVLSIER